MKPAPIISDISRPFWEGCTREELHLQRCTSCTKYIYYPRVCCPYCASEGLVWEKTSGTGRIASFTVIHRTNHVGFDEEVPYIFIAVELAEGPILYSRLTGSANDYDTADLLGHPVRTVFVAQTPQVWVPHFALNTEGTR